MIISRPALEEIKNYSVCVLENDFVRNINNHSDINKTLVFVSNISLCDNKNEYREIKYIKKHDLCRCIEIIVMAKDFI